MDAGVRAAGAVGDVGHREGAVAAFGDQVGDDLVHSGAFDRRIAADVALDGIFDLEDINTAPSRRPATRPSAGRGPRRSRASTRRSRRP